MKKNLKKLDKSVISALTIACEEVKLKVSGFEWLTHRANYERFPSSLKVICVFDTQHALEQAKRSQLNSFMCGLIKDQLLKFGIKLKDSQQNICFDTEQACTEEHGGNWKKRLNQHVTL